MSAELTPFVYQGATLRAISIDGEPGFIANDVCAILDIRNSRDALGRLDVDEKGVVTTDTLGGPQQTAIVTESGLYSLIFTSRKPEAREFKRWVTHEVLPAIRKTGGYSTAVAIPQTYAEALRAAADQADRADRAEQQVAELAPKAAIADDFLTASGGARLVREAAKLLGMREKDLRRFLIDERLVFVKHAPCGAVQYDHYAQYAHHFKATEHVVNHSWGSCTHYTLTILPRGIELIQKRRGQLAVAQ
ncbi:phage antirepressor [Nocardia cyriacigeorgica]|uniref:phage antirepressor n=1 Tax=Nocardia cyriacigeorgica TaxID=135487 RepID=UPI001E420C9D|nr:phage antirepressor KilAC domain-containing protein [Nocardia cyriacigeorgica]